MFEFTHDLRKCHLGLFYTLEILSGYHCESKLEETMETETRKLLVVPLASERESDIQYERQPELEAIPQNTIQTTSETSMKHCDNCQEETERVQKLNGELCSVCRTFFTSMENTYRSYNIDIQSSDFHALVKENERKGN